MSWARRTSALDARSAWCLGRSAFVNAANRLHVRDPSPGSCWGGLGRPGEGTVPTRSCRAAAVPARVPGSVDAASRDLQVGRRVAAAHLEQLIARVAELGRQAVPGRLVGHRPADGGLAASHRPASSSPRVQQPLGEPEPSRPAGAVGPKGLVVAGQGGGGALVQRGVDHARLHQHHQHAEGGQLQPQRVRGRLQGELGRRVQPAARQREPAQDAGDVHDATASSLAHRREERPGDGQGAEQVDLQLRPGLLLRDGLHRPGDEDPGGVDQHVQPVPAGLGRDLVAGAVDGGSRGAGHQDESLERWGCWPGGHRRGLDGHGVSPAGW
jgi:hypothetical protein